MGIENNDKPRQVRPGVFTVDTPAEGVHNIGSATFPRQMTDAEINATHEIVEVRKGVFVFEKVRELPDWYLWYLRRSTRKP